MRSSDFIQTIGINTHLSYWTTSYASASGGADPQKTLTALQYLGIDQVRDTMATMGTGNQSQYSLPAYEALAAAGIHFDIIAFGSTPWYYQQPVLDALAESAPGALVAVEGPNEVDNWPFTYNGLTGTAAAVAFQTMMYSAVHSDTNLTGVNVYDYTIANMSSSVVAALGSQSAIADSGSLHSYQGFGAPSDHLLTDIDVAQALTPGKPIVLTEAGYYTNPTAGVWGSVSQDVQAKYTLDLLLDAEKDGVARTYLYELLDSSTDPAGTYNLENHFGLFNADGTPKEAAVALHNFTSILGDSGGTAATFTPGSLNLSVSGLPTNGNTLLMQKSDGTYELVIWAEPEIWSHVTLTEAVTPVTQVTVSLGATYSHVETFDPLSGSTATSSLTGISQVSVGITDHPIIIQIDPGTVAATVPSSGASSSSTSSPSSGSASTGTSTTTTSTSAASSSAAILTAPTASTATISTATIAGIISAPPVAATQAATSVAIPAIAQQTTASGGQMQVMGGMEYTSPSSLGGQVDLLYTATLGRAPDSSGLGYWIAQLQNGASLVTVAQSLVNSAEYQNNYGGQSNAAFVSGLYNALLERAPDSTGLNYWTGILDSGAETKAQLAAGFATTPEIMQIQSQAGATGGLANGLFAADPNAVMVEATYLTVLGRGADAGGLASWVGMMRNGLSENDLLNAFTGTPEFQASTAALGSAAFVQAVETNAYGGADAGSVAYWAAAIDSGGVSRAGVAMAYVNSGAMQSHAAALLAPG